MRKLFIFLVTFIAVVTFIRAFDNGGNPRLEIVVPAAENNADSNSEILQN